MVQYYNTRIGFGCSVVWRSWWLEPWTLLVVSTEAEHHPGMPGSWNAKVPGESEIQPA
jgi:hypothetical protein